MYIVTVILQKEGHNRIQKWDVMSELILATLLVSLYCIWSLFVSVSVLSMTLPTSFTCLSCKSVSVQS